MANQKPRTKSTKSTLRGLNSNSIVTTTRTQQMMEIDGNSEAVPQQVAHKYGTRTAKHGRAADTYDKYDIKHHPADWKLRPAQAAKRRSGSGSGKRSLSVSTLANEEDWNGKDTDKESLVRSARDDASEEDSDESGEEGSLVYSRQPDPGALRNSKRTEAKKFVNYNTKHHKDDHRIPGFQHKARQLKRGAADDLGEGNVRKRQRRMKRHKPDSSPSPSRSQQSDDADDLVEQALSTLDKIAPFTARDLAKLNAETAVALSNEQSSSVNDSEESDDVELENDPLPAFTTFQDSEAADGSQSEPQISSQGIDKELLNFTQIPTSDGAGASNTTASKEATVEARGSSTGANEARYSGSDETVSESSSTLQHLSTSSKEDREVNTSPPSPDGMPITVESEPNGTRDIAEMAFATAESQTTAPATTQSVLESMQSEQAPGIAPADSNPVAKIGHEDQSQVHFEEPFAGEEEPLAIVDETQASEKTLEGDTSLEGTLTTKVRSVSVAASGDVDGEVSESIQAQSTEQVSATGTREDHRDEAVERVASTLQAMLEQDIAASERAVANSSSSDIMI